MHRVAVVIGAAGDQQTEIDGQTVITSRSDRVVIGVIGLECIETSVAQCGNSRVDPRTSGMRQRRHSAGTMNRLDHHFRGWSGPLYERRLILTEPFVERLTRVGDVTSSHHRACDLWSADRTAALLRNHSQRVTQIDGHPEFGEPSSDRVHTIDTRASLRGEKLQKRRIGRPKEIAKHVNVAAVFDGSDLDTRNGVDAALGGAHPHLVD